MQLDSDYLDFLQNMEFAVVQVYKANPGLRDPDVIRAYDRLIKYYERKKKHLPGMEVTLEGNARLVFDAVFTICEWRRKKDPGETVELEGFDSSKGDVPIVAVVRCLEKLLKSVNRWHKKDGMRGYLNFIINYIF
jgi:hypothetical protein